MDEARNEGIIKNSLMFHRLIKRHSNVKVMTLHKKSISADRRKNWDLKCVHSSRWDTLFESDTKSTHLVALKVSTATKFKNECILPHFKFHSMKLERHTFKFLHFFLCATERRRKQCHHNNGKYTTTGDRYFLIFHFKDKSKDHNKKAENKTNFINGKFTPT